MKEYVNLLWTGGWDSTFRLLQLVLLQARPVQPYYLIDPGRRSSLMELASASRIRKAVAEKFPERAALVRPSIIRCANDIPANAAISEGFLNLRSRAPLGLQYECFARFVASEKLVGLEIAFHIDDREYLFVHPHLVAEEEPTNRHSDGMASSFILDPRCDDQDIATVFSQLRFPVARLTKRQMHSIALAHNFLDIMEKTWFCHRPRRGAACGLCGPCRTSIQQGMGYRIPFRRRWVYLALRPLMDFATKVRAARYAKRLPSIMGPQRMYSPE